MLLVALNLVLGGGGGGEGGVRIGLGSVVVAWGGGEDEGPVLGLLVVPVVVVVVVGGEVDAGAALEGGEEGGSDAGPHPGRPALHGRRGDRSAARVTGVGQTKRTRRDRQARKEEEETEEGGRTRRLSCFDSTSRRRSAEQRVVARTPASPSKLPGRQGPSNSFFFSFFFLLLLPPFQI